MKFYSVLASAIGLAGCISPYQPQGAQSVELVSNYPIKYLDGQAVTMPYRIQLHPGVHRVVIEYQTYTSLPLCTFEWNANADTRYEVTDSGEAFPLTLYRWAYVNRFWSRRADPVLPLGCD